MVDATRVHLTSMSVVSFVISSAFGRDSLDAVRMASNSAVICHAPCGQCDLCTVDKKQWRQALKEDLASGAIQPQEWLLSKAPGHRHPLWALLATWYRSGVIEANPNWIRWSGKEAQG